MKLRTVLPALLLCACVADFGADDQPMTGELDSALGNGLHSVTNLAGATRYVRVSDREVKLYMNYTALYYDNPKFGFRNENHFKDSCGPTAAMNVFKWYGIDVLGGESCFWMYESEADLEGGLMPAPIWVCQPNITASKLGWAMKTNTWRLATVTMPGTNTSNFNAVFRDYMEAYMPSNLEYQYRYEEGDGLSQYKILWATLKQGNPIVINYKTGATKGHFAVIVGMEKVGNDNDISNDKIILANARKEDLNGAITYGKFRELWRRDYYDFGLLETVGEHRYTRLSMWDTNETWPITGGGGGLDPSGPIHMK